MRAYIPVGAFIGAIVLSALPSEAKDLTLRQRVSSGGPRPSTQETTQYWTGNRVVNDGATTRLIVDLDGATVTVIDKQRRTFYTQTFAELSAQAEAIRPSSAHLPPQMREAMAKRGVDPKSLDAPVTLKPTGKQEKIAGYAAKEYAIEGGMRRGSVWVSEALEAPTGAKTGEALARITGSTGAGARLGRALAELKGVPLRTSLSNSTASGASSSKSEVIAVGHQPPPAEVTQIPKDFTKIDPPKFGGQLPGKPAAKP